MNQQNENRGRDQFILNEPNTVNIHPSRLTRWGILFGISVLASLGGLMWIGSRNLQPVVEDGAEPIQVHCDKDARTANNIGKQDGTAEIKDDHNQVIGIVELRYSPSCNANWAKVTSRIGAASLSGTVVREDGVNYSKQLNNSVLYTPIVLVPYQKKARAIGSINGHSAQTPMI